MSKMYVGAVCACLAWSAAVWAAYPTPPQFVDYLEAATGQIRSYDIRVKFREDSPVEVPKSNLPIVFDYRQVWVRDGWHFRSEYEARSLKFNNVAVNKEVFVSSGGEERVLHTKDKTGLIRPALPSPLEEGFDYLSFFLSANGMYEFPRLLKSRLTQGAQVTRSADGRLTLKVPPPVKDDGHYGDNGFEITVDPSFDFLPVEIRVMETLPDGKLALRRLTTIDRIERLPDGLAVPTRATTRFYSTDPKDHFGEEDYSITAEVDVRRSRWNVAIPDDVFRLGFPVGTVVLDDTRGIKFVSGTSDPGTTVEKLLEQARETLPAGSMKSFKTAGRPYWWRDWRWLSGLAAAVLVVGFTAYRLRRTPRPTPGGPTP